jgi:hypothetical protein
LSAPDPKGNAIQARREQENPRISSELSKESFTGVPIREFRRAPKSPNSNRKMNGAPSARNEMFTIEVQPFSGLLGGEEYLKLDYFQ